MSSLGSRSNLGSGSSLGCRIYILGVFDLSFSILVAYGTKTCFGVGSRTALESIKMSLGNKRRDPCNLRNEKRGISLFF